MINDEYVESGQMVHVISPTINSDGCEVRVEKTRVISSIGAIAFKTGSCNDTRWYFADECPKWASYSTTVDKISVFLTGIASLSKEGFYCNVANKWRRKYISKHGFVINLVEDVPAEGGQNCLWAAGLVMSRYVVKTEADVTSQCGVYQIFGITPMWCDYSWKARSGTRCWRRSY